VLVEIHREAQTFFVTQLEGTLEESSPGVPGRSRADKDTIGRFGIGYSAERRRSSAAPFARKYPEKTW
jgi:hypothetical protein